jgi:hypothetical protein
MSGPERDAYHPSITLNGLTPERDSPMEAYGRDPWHVTRRGKYPVIRNFLVISLDVLLVATLIVLAVAEHW